MNIKPDGVNELDPCVYETIEYYTNVDVEIVRCKNCGNIEVLWHRNENTEKINLDELGE
jgi:hypothetical protein